MKKIILSVPDRLQLKTLLPQSGRIIEMELVEIIKEKVRFSTSEIEEFELRDIAPGSVIWSKQKAKDREYRFEDSEIEVLKNGIDQADKNAQITSENLVLAKRILAIKLNSRIVK